MSLPKHPPFLGWVLATILFTVVTMSCRNDPVSSMGDRVVVHPDYGCPMGGAGGLIHPCEFTFEPGDPNNPRAKACDSPITRGSTVSCEITLPEFHTFVPDSFRVRTFMKWDKWDTTVGTTLTWSDGIPDSAWANGSYSIRSWKTSGKAVATTIFLFEGAALDSSGTMYSFADSNVFHVIYPFPNMTLPSGAATVEAGYSLSDTVAKVYQRKGMQLGAYDTPFIDHGGTTADYIALLNRTARFTTMGSLSVDSATSGPNKGFKFIVDTFRLTNSFVRLSRGVAGLGPWAADQDGDDENGDTVNVINGTPYVYCSVARVPSLFSNLRGKIERHEGSTVGETSHHDFARQAINVEMASILPQVQQNFVPNNTSPVDWLYGLQRIIAKTAKQITAYDDNVLDNSLEGQLRSLLGCTFDNVVP